MQVLVVNAGSSSLKLRLLDGHDAVVAAAGIRWSGALTCRPGTQAAMMTT
jgi:acetate kinase